jgi:hypothetical protein
MPKQTYLDDVYEEIERMNPEYSKDAEFKHIEDPAVDPTVDPAVDPEPVKKKTFKIIKKYSEVVERNDYMKSLLKRSEDNKYKKKLHFEFNTFVANLKDNFDVYVDGLSKIDFQYLPIFENMDKILKMTISQLKEALNEKGITLPTGSKKNDYMKKFFNLNDVPFETRKLNKHQIELLREASAFFGFVESVTVHTFKYYISNGKKILKELLMNKLSKKNVDGLYQRSPYDSALRSLDRIVNDLSQKYYTYKDISNIYKELYKIRLEDISVFNERIRKEDESKQAEEPKKPAKFIKVIPILEVDKNLSEDQLKELHIQTKFFNIILSRYYSACNNEKNDKLPDLYDDIRQRSRDIRTKYGYLLDWVVCKNKKTKEDSRRAIQKDKDNARKAFEEKKKSVQKQKDTKQEFEQDID